jgi:hypothetical protein
MRAAASTAAGARPKEPATDIDFFPQIVAAAWPHQEQQREMMISK